jgi:phosphoenolpyruvate synthase/pyruvate phosphate dikinase
VMFTADPVSGDRGTIVVDASSGLGEAVVSGLMGLQQPPVRDADVRAGCR